MSGNNSERVIDIPLDGVGVDAPAPRSTAQRSSIDIPLEAKRSRTPKAETGSISALELEMVNRHHAEIKELHRRARQGE